MPLLAPNTGWPCTALLLADWLLDLPRVTLPGIGPLREVDGTLLVLMLATSFFLVVTMIAGMITLGVHAWRRYRQRAYRRERDEWRAALLDVLAGEKTPEALSDGVRPRQRSRFLSFLSVYANSVRGEELERIRTTALPFLAAVQEKTESRRSAVRAHAVQRLSLFGDDTHLPVLRAALEDPSETVARMALMGLARRGTPEDADLVIQHLDRLSNIDRRQLISALVELGEDAASILRQAMASSMSEDEPQSAFTRLICAEALRWLADAASAPVAVSLLEQDADDLELRAALLRLLRRVGRAPHAPTVRAQCHSEVPFIRIHAARALGQLGTAADEDLLASLLFNDESRWVALSAVQSLSELGLMSPIRQLAQSSHERTSLAEGLLPHSV